MITVQELLSRKAGTIHSVKPQEAVLTAIQMMATHSIGAVLVMTAGKLEGIVSERDYARKIVLLGRSSNDTAVHEIMSAPVLTVAPNDTLDACMRIMTERRIRHLPVVERGQVVGVLSIGDLVKAVIDEQQRTIEQLETYIRS